MNKIQIRAEVFSSINDIYNRAEKPENVLYNSVKKLSVIDGNEKDVVISAGRNFVTKEDGHGQERGQKDGNAAPVGMGDSQQVFRFARHPTALESVFG